MAKPPVPAPHRNDLQNQNKTERLVAALRANLARRKVQARARAAAPDQPEPDQPAPDQPAPDQPARELPATDLPAGPPAED